MTDSPIDAPLLNLSRIIGFSGGVGSGLQVHPDGQHIIYPVGCTVVVESLSSGKKEFLSGHTDNVTCLTVSKSGKYIASGQVTYMGFKADIIIWDVRSRSMYAKLTLHMVKVEALAFSPNEHYLASLGGADDGSVVVWDIARKQPICGSPAQAKSAGMTHTVAYSNCSDNVFVTGGSETLCVWELDVANRKIRSTNVNIGGVKRVVKSVQFVEDDSYFYCGTTTGDIMCVNSSTRILQNIGPENNRFSMGVTAMSLLKNGDLLVGAGDGTIAVVKGKEKNFKRTKNSQKLTGAIMSIALRGKGHEFFVGTEQNNVYRFNLVEWTYSMMSSCHYGQVNDVIFAHGCGSLYTTCSIQDIRVWELASGKELMRITVPNMTCNSIDITRDGKVIISGWDDGRIRAFYPESGKPMYTIQDAHKGGVTALATYTDGCHIVSGGQEGNVRVWQVFDGDSPKGRTKLAKLLFSLNEHKASVTSIKVRKNNQECVTSSTDGTCIIWDLINKCRSQMIRQNTLFKYVCYHPAEHQFITAGTDRKIGYWETCDLVNPNIRQLDGSTGPINGMDITGDGSFFVSGGDDKLVKVWKYNEGEVTHIGIGHGAPITRVKISPDEQHIVSVSTDGAIMCWKFPQELFQDQ